MAEFDYFEAFSRNLGFISSEQQARLQQATVAIAGLGGTGGAQVHALSRLGIGGFHLADPDTFELVNFNRQSGATMASLSRRKTEVAHETVAAINPQARVTLFDDGINDTNIDAFLDGVNVVIDSLDFYCFDERFLLYRSARERGLWVLTAPPLGFGFTMLIFNPRGMSFENYFDLRPEMGERDKIVALIAGIAPKPYMLEYLDRSRPQLGARRLPSVGAAPFLIAGAIASETLTVLLGEPKFFVPRVYQFDARLHRFRARTYRWGMRTPLQRLRRAALKRFLPS